MRRRVNYDRRRTDAEVLDGILKQRECDHKMRLVATCAECQAYAERRLAAGLIRNPFRIPF